MKALTVRLRPAQLADLYAIVALDRATELAPHWPVAAYTSILEVTSGAHESSPSRCLIVAERIAAESAPQSIPLIGFAVGLLNPPGDNGLVTAELEDIVVAANCRRAGIGRVLCAAVLEWCRSHGATEIALEVRAANAAAVALYTQLGFERVGCRLAYYRNPEDDAIAMRLQWM